MHPGRFLRFGLTVGNYIYIGFRSVNAQTHKTMHRIISYFGILSLLLIISACSENSTLLEAQQNVPPVASPLESATVESSQPREAEDVTATPYTGDIFASMQGAEGSSVTVDAQNDGGDVGTTDTPPCFEVNNCTDDGAERRSFISIRRCRNGIGFTGWRWEW